MSSLLLNSAQTQALDHYCQGEAGRSGFSLMQLAASRCVDHLTQSFDLAHAVVLCGGGNNGGDGWEVARLLHQQGCSPKVFSTVDPALLTGDASRAFEGAKDLVDWSCHLPALEPATVIVDAVLGVGFTPPLKPELEALFDRVNRAEKPILSVDIPSGVDATTGAAFASLQAAMTVTFFAPKIGLFTGPGRERSGRVVVEDLGCRLGATKLNSVVGDTVELLEHLTPLEAKPGDSYKHQSGHVLIIAGEERTSGAAIMSAESALFSGAGLVTLACSAAVAQSVFARSPELMTCHLDSESIAERAERAEAVVIGPGWKLDRALLATLDAIPKSTPVVVDAGALRCIRPEHTANMRNLIFTPHAGEAAHLLGTSIESINNNRLAAASMIAEQYNAHVVLKGPGTVITSANEQAVNSSGNAALATAGSGDILCGVIAGLIAQQVDLGDAIKRAVFYHGRAAEIWSVEHGLRGLYATELLPIIRRLINGKLT